MCQDMGETMMYSEEVPNIISKPHTGNVCVFSAKRI
jgi:hypothetical protein